MLKVLKNIEDIIHKEMEAVGAQEVCLSMLQPSELWEKSGRWERFVKDGLMMRVNHRNNYEIALSPTQEEGATELVHYQNKSYKKLPLHLYQIQTKFRDEIRPRYGLLRAREFMMKDSYSFHASQESLDEEYTMMAEAYTRIFDKCGIPTIQVEGDNGLTGGLTSHEFMYVIQCREDRENCGENFIKYIKDEDGNILEAVNATDGKKLSDKYRGYPIHIAFGVEVGNIFKLGTTYSEKLDAMFLDKDNTKRPYFMGTYGIGVSRLAATIVEHSNDENGIIWPLQVAPYEVVIVVPNVANEQQVIAAERLYKQAKEKGIKVILDDRNISAGAKFKDADLMGFPIKVVPDKSTSFDMTEVKLRGQTNFTKYPTVDVIQTLLELINTQKQVTGA